MLAAATNRPYIDNKTGGMEHLLVIYNAAKMLVQFLFSKMNELDFGRANKPMSKFRFCDPQKSFIE
jgi:hypothetical protein